MKKFIFLFVSVCFISKGFAQKENNDKVIRIPVIFHVLHWDRNHSGIEGGNTDENVSTDLILKELKDLHDDFLLLNADTSEVIPEYKKIIGNPNIEFYLADTVLQANGEKGIIRVETKKNRNKLYQKSPVIQPEKYLNVYIGDIGGSFSPSDTPWSTPYQDAVYLAFDWIGLRYRLLTHEAGHWCGLLHLWGTGNAWGDKESCSVGDYINDTPLQKEATETDAACVTCPPPVGRATDKSCTPGVRSNFNNYMDYSGCRRMFTEEQVIALRNNLKRFRSKMWNAN